ncbi:hypothetical protein RFI_13966 [Reticulomyxa filosa]|uniref:Transmembrane protein n=1 Tax=Reticulomyxa filosa TaxID=46433 RepID=X6NBD9_RETFI|nr:hypothetical protein RFI_13966 [Reticulomyxa filosa]|eukprot:ETO23213.1 hypothetical protein RFI_13966 [Reticulomyxa filosa]
MAVEPKKIVKVEHSDIVFVWVVLSFHILAGIVSLLWTIRYMRRTKSERGKMKTGNSKANEFLIRRRPRIVIVFLWFCWSHVLIFRPLQIFFQYTDNESSVYRSFLWGFSAFGLAYTFVLRFCKKKILMYIIYVHSMHDQQTNKYENEKTCRTWMLYFDQRLQYAQRSLGWKKELVSDAENNWFIKNRNTFGKPIWLILYFFTPLWATPSFGNSTTNFAVDSACLLVPVLLTLIIWSQIPKWNDRFLIKMEIKYSMYVAFAGLVVYAAVIYFIPSASRALFLTFLFSAVVFIGAMISSAYILYLSGLLVFIFIYSR